MFAVTHTHLFRARLYELALFSLRFPHPLLSGNSFVPQAQSWVRPLNVKYKATLQWILVDGIHALFPFQ